MHVAFADTQEFRGKRRGVQKELLSLMEGTSVSTRIGRISVRIMMNYVIIGA